MTGIKYVEFTHSPDVGPELGYAPVSVSDNSIFFCDSLFEFHRGTGGRISGSSEFQVLKFCP